MTLEEGANARVVEYCTSVVMAMRDDTHFMVGI
jgi:hypothetical protein